MIALVNMYRKAQFVCYSGRSPDSGGLPEADGVAADVPRPACSDGHAQGRGTLRLLQKQSLLLPD